MRHSHEGDRLESLRSYAVFGTEPEPEFDALTALASRITRSPVALITFVEDDAQWVKSSHGARLPDEAVAEHVAGHVVGTGEPLAVLDLRRDPRFAEDTAAARGEGAARSFAAVPLAGRDGLPLGALCVLDRRPRRYTPGQLELLTRLADQAMMILELRRGDAVRGLRPGASAAEIRDPRRLRAALDDEELVPYFQPVVDLATRRLRGLEALLRWEHPVLGTLLPAHFLPAMELSALMLPVGRRVLGQSLSVLRDLRCRGGRAADLTVAVNVSYAQLSRPGLSGSVLTALERCEVPPDRLMLEITESTDLADPEVVRAELGRVREAGVLVALDDYGTGFSCLERVLELPFTTLKLDRGLVARLPEDERAAIVVEATVRMAAGLGMSVVAEGIESAEQRHALLALGCDRGQGYHFGRAVTAASVLPLADRWESEATTSGGWPTRGGGPFLADPTRPTGPRGGLRRQPS